ncbi:GIY-YIG nuclease family protein [Candidatus Nomurabacteria bacterium]|nr:GIY-YIG nuclease family protein [Candidatus Nomurabacteria bacterium]
MFTTYAIKSKNRNYIYVGITNDIDRRLKEHNTGINKTTKPYKPFLLLYSKTHDSRVKAREHEKKLKSGSGKEFLKSLVK